MMSGGDAGSEVLETRDDEIKISDRTKTKFDVIIISEGP